jgi:hypothetical protein
MRLCEQQGMLVLMLRLLYLQQQKQNGLLRQSEQQNLILRMRQREMQLMMLV